MPKVSIIVPVYNAENDVRMCIDSLLAQTLKDIEIIAVDDGSTDSSHRILMAYAALDPRLMVIRCENGGVSRARNIGIEHATGEYIGFVDADDWVDSGMFEGMRGHSERYGLDVCICDYCREYLKKTPVVESMNLPENILLPRRIIEEELIKGTLYGAYFGAVWKLLIRRETLARENIRFCEQLDFMEDNIFDLHLFFHSERIMYVRQCYYHYRNPSAGNLSSKYRPDWDELIRALVKETNRFIDQHYLPFSEYRPPYELGLCYIAAICILNICKRTNDADPRDKIRNIGDLLENDLFFNSIKRIDTNECYQKVCGSSSPMMLSTYLLLKNLMQKRRAVLLYLVFSSISYMQGIMYYLGKCKGLLSVTRQSAMRMEKS